MKKKILATTLIAAIAIGTAVTASANWGQRGRYWNDNNRGPRMEMQSQQLDPAVKEKLDKFFADTQDIRKDIAIKRAEKMALTRSETPDPAAVGTITGELFDLHYTMRQKAEEAGVATYLGSRGRNMGGRDLAQGRRGMGKGGRQMNNMQPGYEYGNRGNW